MGSKEFSQRPESPREADEFKVKLATNPTLDALARELREKPIDWDQLIDTANGQKLRMDRVQVRGHLGELWSRSVAEEVAKKELPEPLTLDPIQDGERTENYLFYKHPTYGTIHAGQPSREKEGGFDIATDYDLLAKAGELPVMGQVRIARRRINMVSILRNDRINASAAPVMERFRTDTLGAMAISLPNLFNPDKHFEREFVKAGGLLVPLPTTFKEFDRQAKKVTLYDKYGNKRE